MIALHMYDSALKIIPMDAKGALKEAFNVRLEEFQARHVRR
jgi:DNA damage-binding protein 1